MTEDRKVALGRDIQKWLVEGLEHVVLETPPPLTIEVRAVKDLVQQAKLVILVL